MPKNMHTMYSYNTGSFELPIKMIYMSELRYSNARYIKTTLYNNVARNKIMHAKTFIRERKCKKDIYATQIHIHLHVHVKIDCKNTHVRC